MKKFLFTLACVLITSGSICSYGQSAYTQYHSSYFDKDYSIALGTPEPNGLFTYYITIQDAESKHDVNLFIESDKIEAFVLSLKQCLSKYIEWKNVAIENNVTDLSKNIDVKFSKVSAAFLYGRDWNFDFSVSLSARFRVTTSKDYVLIIDTDKLQSGSNQYINLKSAYIVLSSEEDIQEFINALDLGKAKEFQNKQTDKTDLFN